MAGSILGTAVRRVEDPELLLGTGTFVANVRVDGLLHAAFARSAYAHARLVRIDLSATRDLPGVVGAFGGTDLGLGPYAIFKAIDEACNREPLTTDRGRYVGDPLAIVVAESHAEALDGAEAVEVDYEPLESVTDAESALAPGAAVQFGALSSNRVAGERDADGHDPLGDAEVIVRARFENQRMAVAPIEPNGICAIPGDPGATTILTVYVSTQQPHVFRNLVCSVLGYERDAVRVISPHVGGGFGGKVGLAPEYVAVVATAMRLGRPVRWIESRTENLIGMNGRSQVQYASMGLRRDGTMLGMAYQVVGDTGAYGGFGGSLCMGQTRVMSQGVYDVGGIRYDVATALTNTSPLGAVRGAGRPESSTMVERLVDIAAVELGIDPAELRRKNLIRSDQFPFRTHTGLRYDSGDYAMVLDRCLAEVGYAELRAEQARRRTAGQRWQLGIGISTYVEITNGAARTEFGGVTVDEEGTLTVRAGTSAHGQGHATAFAMIASDRLGIPMDQIRYVQSDTALVPSGGGTGGSRSLQLGGLAVARASDALWERAIELAAQLFEADPADIVRSESGGLSVAGVPARTLGWAELAGAAQAAGEVLEATVNSESGGATFPFGCHVSVVEVDLETGFVRPVRHVAVDDAGRVINPLIFTGQQHGGIATGIAQALYEEIRYDESGNPITATFADYTIASAADLCSFEALYTETPTPLNPLGVKGIGEAGTTGATPAVQNAVVDAVSFLGVRHVDLPCTPERVWRAITAAAAGALPPIWRDPPPVFEGLRVRAPAGGGDSEM